MKCSECGWTPPERPIERNLSTPEARAFWESVDKIAAEVRTWPAWKRAFYHPDEICKTCGHASIMYGYDGP